MDHLSLVLFTLLAQSAAGITLICALMVLLNRAPLATLQKGFILALILFADAMIASMTHLGQPLRAFNVIYGLQHGSALSIEILAASVLGGILFAIVVLLWLGKLTQLIKPLAALAILASLALVQAIANVYTLRAVTAWYTWLTSLQFFQTMLTVGSVCTALVLLGFHPTSKGGLTTGMRNVVSLLGSVALVVVMVKALMLMPHLSSLNMANGIDQYALLLTIAGTVLWLLPMVMKRNSSVITSIALALVAIGEIMARVSFYDLLHYQVM